MALNLAFGFPSRLEIGTLPAEIESNCLIDIGWLKDNASKVHDINPNFVCEISSQSGAYVVKWFGWRSSFHYFISPFIESRAQVSWEIANAMKDCGVGTPAPVFTCTLRKKGFIKENIFITDSIKNHQTLRQWLLTYPSSDRLDVVLSKLAVNLSRMHNAGIYHNDLTIGNVLLDDDLEIYLIDLNRGEQTLPNIKKCLKDLSKLYFGPGVKEELDNRITFFFQEYGKSIQFNLDWESGYRTIRAKRNRIKKIKRRIKGLVRMNH